MNSLNKYFLGRYESRSASEATQAQHLYIFNWLFIAVCIYFIPVNISAGDMITFYMLPICIAFTIISQFLIAKGRAIGASYLSVAVCLGYIALDLFVATEPPGINLLYRGLLSYIVIMIATPLFFSDRSISIKLGLFTFVVLALVYIFKMLPGTQTHTINASEIAYMAIMLVATIVFSFLNLRVNRNFIAPHEEKKIGLETQRDAPKLHLSEKSIEVSRALENLRKEEELYRSIVENSHDGIVIVDDKGKIVFVNTEMSRIIGYAIKEIIDQPFINLVADEFKSIAYERFKRRQAGENVPTVYEVTLIGKSGAKIHGEVRVAIYVTPDDRLQSVVQFLDLTSRKRSENTLVILHELAIKLAGTIETDQAMDLIMDMLLRIDEVDCGGLYIRNVITGDIFLSAHRGLSDQFVSAISFLPSSSTQVNLLKKGQPIHVYFPDLMKSFGYEEEAMQSPEGLLALASIPLIYAGELIGALNAASHSYERFSEATKNAIESLAAQVSSVVERLRWETALRESEKKYRELVEHTDSIFYTMNDENIITYISPAIQIHTGYSPEEIIGHQFMQFVHPDDRQFILQKYNELIRENLGPGEYRLVAKNGNPVWIISNSRPIIVDGKLKGIIGVFTNITETKMREKERLETERKLLHTQKLESLGVLTGGIAHDFNNILTAMMGNIELAGLHLKNDSPSKIFLEEAHLATRRAADLVRQMLVYTGKVLQNLQTIRIGKAVEDIMILIRSSISKKAILISDLSKDKNAIKADITQIQQVAMNLVINASEALGDGHGTITMETGEIFCNKKYLLQSRAHHDLPEGNYAYLEVRDTGYGITEENLDRIFDPFFTTKFAGRGLGMAAVLGIVRAHSGAIIIESEPGNGTKVRVLFPIAAESLTEGKTIATEEKTIEKSKSSSETNITHTLLLVDDDRSVLQAGSSMLQTLGYSVVQAHNGREAINLFKASTDIAASIIDLSMPIMDGRQVLMEIKKINPAAICILASGHPKEDVMTEESNSIADGFLQKPYTLGNLEKTLKKLLMRNELNSF